MHYYRLYIYTALAIWGTRYLVADTREWNWKPGKKECVWDEDISSSSTSQKRFWSSWIPNLWIYRRRHLLLRWWWRLKSATMKWWIGWPLLHTTFLKEALASRWNNLFLWSKSIQSPIWALLPSQNEIQQQRRRSSSFYSSRHYKVESISC